VRQVIQSPTSIRRIYHLRATQRNIRHVVARRLHVAVDRRSVARRRKSRVHRRKRRVRNRSRRSRARKAAPRNRRRSRRRSVAEGVCSVALCSYDEDVSVSAAVDMVSTTTTDGTNAPEDYIHRTQQETIISSDVDIFAALPRLFQYTSRERFRVDPVGALATV